MPNPLNNTPPAFFQGGKSKAGRAPSRRKKKEPEPEPEPEPLEEPKRKQGPKEPKAGAKGPYVPPGGTKEIAKLLHNLVGVKKSREKASGASSAKK